MVRVPDEFKDLYYELILNGHEVYTSQDGLTTHISYKNTIYEVKATIVDEDMVEISSIKEVK